MRSGPLAVPTALCLLLVACASQAAVLGVDCTGGAQYLTIQEAVDAAASGDTIRLAPCTYAEQVIVSGKVLTIEGSGVSITEIYWDGTPPAVHFESMPSPWTSYVRDVSVVQAGVDRVRVAVEWPYGHVVFERCYADSVVWGDMDTGVYEHTSAEVYDSTFESLRIIGDGESVVDGSTIVNAAFHSVYEAGTNWQPIVSSSGNSYGTLTLLGAAVESAGDEMEALSITGGENMFPELYAVGSSLGTVGISKDTMVELDQCDMTGLSYTYSSSSYDAPIRMNGCLVRGSVDLVTDT